MLIRKSTVNYLSGFPTKDLEMVLKSDLETLTLTDLKYRAPWDLLPGRSKFNKGTVVVAGDAVHAMAPFLAQGGAASLEDAVVLSQCLAKVKVGEPIEVALDEYVRRRRGRVVRLSAQTYLIGLLLSPSSSMVVKLIIILAITIFFRDKAGHTRYDCGRLSWPS